MEMMTIVAVTLVSNVALSQNLVFTQVGFIVSSIVILYVFKDTKEAKYVIASMVLMCILSYGIEGYTQMMSSTGTNIFQYNAIVKDGPAYNVVCDYVVKEWYETGNAEYKSVVNDGDSVFIISDNMEVSASELYLLKPVKIAQYSTICTPTYGHKHVEYWEQFQERLPDVLIVESNMIPRLNENYIYNYLMDNYDYEKVLEGAHYCYYIKK
jgi:hypothetical protein